MDIRNLHDTLIAVSREEIERATDDELIAIECELWNKLAAVESHLKARRPGYVSVLDEVK